MSQSPKNLALARKLLTNLDLTADERRDLDGASVPFSGLVEAVSETLRKSRWFPRPVSDDQGVWAVIERRRFGYIVHRRFEIGILRYSAVKSTRAWRLKAAVLAYVDHYQQLEITGPDAVTLGGVVVNLHG